VLPTRIPAPSAQLLTTLTLVTTSVKLSLLRPTRMDSTRLQVSLSLVPLQIVRSVLPTRIPAPSVYFPTTTLLLMLSGPQVIIPEKVLKEVLGLMSPFSFGNPFEKWTASETCDLPDSFARNDLVCSIFGNYGEDLIVLLVALACPLVHLLIHFLKSNQQRQEEDSRSSTMDSRYLRPSVLHR
jgi:hypothetical protein